MVNGVSQSFHEPDEKVRTDRIALSNSSGWFEPIKILPIPNYRHSHCFNIFHEIPDPSVRKSHVLKRIFYESPIEPVIRFF